MCEFEHDAVPLEVWSNVIYMNCKSVFAVSRTSRWRLVTLKSRSTATATSFGSAVSHVCHNSELYDYLSAAAHSITLLGVSLATVYILLT